MRHEEAVSAKVRSHSQLIGCVTAFLFSDRHARL